MLRVSETGDGEPCEVLVFEAAPYWTPELQRQLSPDEFIVRMCVRRQDVLDRLRPGMELVIPALKDA